MTRVAGIVQARMGSTRLPGKVLLPLGAWPVIACVLDRLSASQRLDEIVVAITENVEDDVLHDAVTSCGFAAVRGSAEDVLARFEYAAKQTCADVVVRITADCPLVDGTLLDRMLERFLAQPGSDYMSNVMRRTYPRGLDLEIFTAEALFAAAASARQPYEREHVTPYIYQHPAQFRLLSYENPDGADYSSIRLTLDTPEDYALLRRIYGAFAINRPRDLSVPAIVKMLEERPELLALNAAVAQKTLGE